MLRIPERLTTPRLVLRRLSEDDAPALKRAIDSSLPRLRRWLPWAKEEPTPLDQMRFLLQLHRVEFECGHQWYFGIFPPDESRLYGVAGLHQLSSDQELEISYWLRTGETGKGYATEAALELTRIVLRRRSVRLLQIRCDPRNERSIAVARRLGYRHLKTLVGDETRHCGRERSMVWQATPASKAVGLPRAFPGVLNDRSMNG